MDPGAVRVESAQPRADTRNVLRAPTIFLLALLGSLLMAVPAAEAARKKTKRPVVTSVTPLSANVGTVMTIKGRHFLPGYGKNMVVLMNKQGRVRYVRSEHSSRKKMTIKLPAKVERLLPKVNGVRVATRFRVKVITKRMGYLATSVLAKPTIGPDMGGDCDGDGVPNPSDADDDNDLLPDVLELKARTNPCEADSDGDGLLDGWEYISALDLNRSALPYPGKRPYPNALFKDAAEDFDGDGLWAWVEHAMWVRGGKRYPLNYSDGTQKSDPIPTGGAFWNDFDWDGEQSDDERDFDNDGLANIYELRHPQFEAWQPWFPATERPNFLDPDSDGDGLRDGEDDQDHDDVSNVDELADGTWAMNPCDPLLHESRTCPKWMDPDKKPVKPTHLCVSRTLIGGTKIPWYDAASASEVGYCPRFR